VDLVNPEPIDFSRCIQTCARSEPRRLISSFLSLLGALKELANRAHKVSVDVKGVPGIDLILEDQMHSLICFSFLKANRS